MKRSVIARFIASVRTTARMLMQKQHRSIANSAVIADLRAMPEHLQRDIGLVDGNMVLEGVAVHRDRDAEQGQRWNDLVVTPHAA
jgi:hypothetical protein